MCGIRRRISWLGSVRRLPSGRWQARYWDASGERLTARSTFATKTAAQRWLSATETDMGRGDWHGDEMQVANDVVLTENERAVSRKAARLHRSAAGLELESLDQREALLVEKSDGESVRPALTASGRVPLAFGDRVAFTDSTIMLK